MLSNNTYLVVVSTPDLGSAHRIFSVMNARGLDLEPADIFKSQVIGALPENLAKQYADKWEDAEQQLTREWFSELFSHLRVVISKERARRELLKEFQEQVLDTYLPGRATEFVDDLLVPYARAYEEMLDHTYSSNHDAAKVNAWFRRLDMLDNNDWRPPAMWALRHHHDDPAWLDQFLRALERLAASSFIRREYATPRVTRYLDLLRQLDAGAGLDAPAFQLSPEEAAETVDGLHGEIYQISKIRKYVLLRLDEVIAHGAGVTYDHPIITVEHVLPQTPEPNAQWRDDFNDDERTYWTHRLANLVLLARYKNSEAQNYDFEKKKNVYFTSTRGAATFALTSQVLATPNWTPAVLKARQHDLTALLAKEWAL